jgi:hypothetical protein
MMAFTPKRSNKYSNKILKIANQSPDEQENVWLIVRLMETITSENPFIKPAELKKKVIKSATDNGLDSMLAERYYRSAQQIVVPFMNSGEKILRTDALIDALILQAKDNLYETVYSKEGEAVGEKFSTSVMDSIIKAASLKMNTLVKVQANLISAQRESNNQQEQKDFNLQNAEIEQLERFVSGEIKDHPELIEKLLSKIDSKDNIEINSFHEEYKEDE